MLTVAHTWHYHRRCRTSGHVWQGRFKSPVIQDDAHLLTVLRYVESNPLRARMVSDLAAYPWSSYVCHGLCKPVDLVDEAPPWIRLGKTENHRQRYWRKWLHTPLSEKELTTLRRSVTTADPTGLSHGSKASPNDWALTSVCDLTAGHGKRQEEK